MSGEREGRPARTALQEIIDRHADAPRIRRAPEDPRTTARAVAAILDGGGLAEDQGLPPELKEVRRFQAAAGRILEAGLPLQAEVILLSQLNRAALKAAIPEFAIHAILAAMAEASEEPLLEPASEWAMLALGRAGCRVCPACKRELPQAGLLERRRAARAAERRRRALRRRDGAA